ncbi:MAG: Omp28-related outer membrane protein [Bacteroidales bacterium]|nr:Omp28-related outer membrane protein [Bacteroidales bacterium]
MKTPRFAALLAAFMTAFACTGLPTPGTDDNTTPNEEQKEEVFTITPTSISLEAVESDFQITVVSSGKEYDITIVDPWITEVSRSGKPATGETIVFHATDNLSDKASQRSGVISVCTKDGNCFPVMVEQAGAFTRKVLGMRFTATWCGYCPYMDEAFHLTQQTSADFIYVTFHASKGYPLYFSDSGALASAYNIQGFPTGVVGGWKEIQNYTDSQYTSNNIISTIESFESKLPAAAVINASAKIDGDKISVNAKVNTLDESADYKVVAIVLESGIVEAQAYYPTSGGSTTLSDFVHDNVARKTLTGSILGDDLTENGEFKWETSLDSSWNKDNLSVAIWVLKPYGKYRPYKAVGAYPNEFITNACIVKF